MTRMLIMTAAALLTFAGTSARADTVATACVKANGTIYNFSAYRSQPTRACRANEKKIRFQLLQDDTAVAKRSATVTRGGAEAKMVTFSVPGHIDPVVEILLGYFSPPPEFENPSEDCELRAFHDETYYRLVKVAPRESTDVFRDAIIFDQDQDPDEDPVSVETERLMLGGGNGPGWALKAHDLFVVNRTNECFAFFVIEFADDAAKLYSK
jgi:hypothetical protein